MPWHLPADLQHFKSVTMKHPIIMGRKTFESIGRPLPGRRNIVISRNSELTLAGADVFNSIDAALAACSDVPKIMIIGGANLYQQMLSQADYLHLTFIELNVEGDAFFPDWEDYNWQEMSREAHQPDDKNAHSYQFVSLKRSPE